MSRTTLTQAERFQRDIAKCEASEQRAMAEAAKFHDRKLALIADAKAAAAALASVGKE